METASSSVLKAQKEREREWPLLKLEAPLHSGKLTYLLISAKVQQVSNMQYLYNIIFPQKLCLQRNALALSLENVCFGLKTSDQRAQTVTFSDADAHNTMYLQ